MSRELWFAPLSTAEYARLHGLSTAKARAQIQKQPGAVKQPNGRWAVYVPRAEYQRLRKLEPKARRRTQQKASSPLAVVQRLAANVHIARLNTLGVTFDPAAIQARMSHATHEQAERVVSERGQQYSDEDYDDEFWYDWNADDDTTILYYHD